MPQNLDIILKATLAKILEQTTYHFTQETPLLGIYPELDSVGIVNLLIELEARCLINMNDADLSADTFATYGALYRKVEALLCQSNSRMVDL